MATLNHEHLDGEAPSEMVGGERILGALFSGSLGVTIAHILCGFVIILLDIAVLGTSLQALLASLRPDPNGGGLVIMGLTYLGFGSVISHFTPLNVILAILVALSVMEVCLRLIQSHLSMCIKARMIQRGKAVHGADGIATKEKAMDEAESLLKALEFGFFCVVVVVALFFLSPVLSLTLVVAGVLLVGLTVLSQRGRARKRIELALKRKEYIAAFRCADTAHEELDKSRVAYFRESLAFKRINARTATILSALQAVVLIVVVVAISYMQFPAAVIALPIVIVLSVRRFLSNGQSAGAKLAKVLERRGFWSREGRDEAVLSEMDQKD